MIKINNDCFTLNRTKSGSSVLTFCTVHALPYVMKRYYGIRMIEDIFNSDSNFAVLLNSNFGKSNAKTNILPLFVPLRKKE